MEKKKWYVKAAGILLVILLLPVIVLFLLVGGICLLFSVPRDKKAYLKSPYYADFQQKFRLGICSDPAYVFYNAAMRRHLPIRFIRQSNEVEYFIYQNTIFLFPNFDTMYLNDDRTAWLVNDDGDPYGFDEHFQLLLAGLEKPEDLPVRVLVERDKICEPNLNDAALPDSVFVTWGYETAFENEDSPLKMIIPQNNAEVWDMMQKTPDLCGEAVLDDQGIHWHLNGEITVNIGIEKNGQGYMDVERKHGKIRENITHWHPEKEDVYQEICKIGKKGSVLVLHLFFGGGRVLYSGPKEDCPYPRNKKVLFGKIRFVEN